MRTNLDTRQKLTSAPTNTLYVVSNRVAINYAVCDTGCSASALKNRTLSAGFSRDLYVLFSLPTNADAVKLVYASDPPLVMALAYNKFPPKRTSVCLGGF